MQHIAVMQPYLFPYLGYYQLVRHVEQFVFFDNVNYIKKGYINRNAILLDGAAHRFTLPVKNASQNRTINDHWFVDEADEIQKLIVRAYDKAPQFNAVYPWVRDVLASPDRKVSSLAALSVQRTFEYLEIPKHFLFSSDIAIDEHAKGQQKILAVCTNLGATRYTNAIGGQDLYDAAAFTARGIALEFIKMNPVTYRQSGTSFTANLSMLDLLMWCSADEVRTHLDAYSILARTGEIE